MDIDETTIFTKYNFNKNKNLINYIINNIHKNIDEYNLSLNEFYKRFMKIEKYKNMFLFIIYRNNKIYTIFNTGDKRKNIIIDIIKNRFIELKNIYKKLPDMFIPFYISDTHFYQDNEIPFFVEAKPKNKKGILYPDKDYYSIKLENKTIDYDKLKKILHKKNCDDISKKKPIIYFSGANTGSDKHNIRYKLKKISENNNKFDIHISEKYVPLYDFCNYKYLLNLPGHQPWSYRMTKILLMNSLIFDVTIMQKYIIEENNKTFEDKNEKWIQIYNDYFIPNEDYIEIIYDWTASVTSDLEVINIYDKINELYKYYENNKDEYIKIVNNASKKANLFNNNICDKTQQYLIMYFTNKIYEKNNTNDINTFLDEIIKLDNKIKINNISNQIIHKTSNQIVDKTSNQIIHKNDINDKYSDYSIKKVFLDKVLNITDRKYNVLTIGEYEKDKLIFLYNNIIKNNKDSLLTIVNPDNKKNISINKNINKKQIKFINSVSIDVLLDELIKVNINNNKFDIIFIFEDSNTKNLLKELIILWNILKYDGFIVVDLYNVVEQINSVGIDKYHYFKTFYEIFKNEILYLENVGKRVIIKKINKKEINKNIPQDIIKTINKYINDFYKYINYDIIMPKQKKIKIEWNFLLNDKKIKNKEIGYNKKAEEIINELYFMDDNIYFSKIRKFNLIFYVVEQKFSYIDTFLKELYINILDENNDLIKNKIDFLKNLLLLNYKTNVQPIAEYLYYMKQKCLKYKKIKIFGISSGFYHGHCKLAMYSKIDRKLKFKLNVDCPIRKNQYELTNLNKLKKNNLMSKNIIEHKYILIENNLFNFDEIIKLSKKYNNNVNYININLFRKLSKVLINIRSYSMYILLNLLYLIFCMQLKDGCLSITYLPIPENALLDYIYILSNYYDEVKLQESYTEIKIHCNGFRGISKSELNNFFTKYKAIYDDNIKNNLNILDIKKEKNNNTEQNINIKYIDRIFSNKINNKFINSYKNYNIKLNEYVFFINKYLPKINDYYDNTNSIKIKKYIFTKIFQEQYIVYLNNISKRKNFLENFYDKCSF